MANDPTVNITAFRGLHNKQQARRLPEGALTVADNIDIDDTGGIILRQGYVKTAGFIDVTAAFATQDERRLFLVSEGQLLLFYADGSSSVLATDVGALPVSWLEVADYVLLSSGHIIDAQNNVSQWRIPSPAQPLVDLIEGNLVAGQYMICTTLVDALGREGGASMPYIVDVEGGGFRVFPSIPDGYSARVYVSDGDGTELYFVGDATDVIDIVFTGDLTEPLDASQQGAFPAPVGATQLAYYESRVWAAEPGEVSVIWYSEPFWWNLFKLQTNFITVPGWVRMMVGLKEGLLIATDDEIYVYNESLVRLADYGVPPGRAYSVDDTGKAFIWTKQGVCSALPFENLTEQKVSLAAEGRCYAEVVEQNGFNKLVVLTQSEGTPDNSLL